MNAAQLALLTEIARGAYVPSNIRKDLNVLGWLYRQGYITYGWSSVELTGKGLEALAAEAEKAGA